MEVGLWVKVDMVKNYEKGIEPPLIYQLSLMG
jgi:hypothetical protein